MRRELALTAEDLHPELYRPGRFYLTASGLVPTCGRLPILLPRKGQLYRALRRGRPWRPVNIDVTVGECLCRLGPACRPTCPLSERIASIPREAGVAYVAGLVWIPACHYPMPADWVNVVEQIGVRWPLANMPADWPPRPKMPVLVAHARGVIGQVAPKPPITPAILYTFRIDAIEYVTGAPGDDARLRRAAQLGVPVVERSPTPAEASMP